MQLSIKILSISVAKMKQAYYLWFMITESGVVVKVRLFTYKSFRHYGGREIKTISHTCSATLIGLQNGHQKYIVELLEPCAGWPTGHKIAVSENNFNI